MPRPRIIQEDAFIGAKIERKQYLVLKEISRRTGRSMSALVREAVERFIREESVRLGLELALAEPEEEKEEGEPLWKRIERAMVSHFGRRLEDVEERLELVEQRLKEAEALHRSRYYTSVAASLDYARCAARLLADPSREINDILKGLRSCARAGIEDRELAERAIALKERIESLWRRIRAIQRKHSYPQGRERL